MSTKSKTELEWTVRDSHGWVHGAESGNREYMVLDWYVRPLRVAVQLWVGSTPTSSGNGYRKRVTDVATGKALAQRWDSMTEAEIAKEADK